MILSLSHCKQCSILIDMPTSRHTCPFCGHLTQKTNRQVLRDAFDRLGAGLDDTLTYVQVIPRLKDTPGSKETYTVIGSMEPLKPYMESTKVA